MKIDHEYLKQLLTACQATDRPTFNIEDLNAERIDYANPAFEFHMAILVDKGFIERENGDAGFGLFKGIDGFCSWSVLPLRLTASGHDFIDTIQNPEVWSMTKTAIKTVGNVGLDIFVQIAKAEAKRFAVEKLGLSL